MDAIYVFGMRRSGLHFIIDVIMSNNNFRLIRPNVIYSRKQELEYKIKKLKKLGKKCIFLVEDKLDKLIFPEEINYINIIIVRDIFDNIVSREWCFLKIGAWAKIDDNYIQEYTKILEEVLNITNNFSNKVIINYDMFKKDYDYQDMIFSKIKLKRDINYDYTKISSPPGKSFKDGEDRNLVKISRETIDLLKNNKNFLELVEQYYNYDLLEKIENQNKSI